MRLIKLMACFALLSSIALVGCNKDKNEVEVGPVLEMGEYHLTWETTNCNDVTENGIETPSCDSDDGCMGIILNDNMTAKFVFIENGTISLEQDGTYTVVDEIITLDFLDKTGDAEFSMDEIMVCTIDSNNKFHITYDDDDDDDGCVTKWEFNK